MKREIKFERVFQHNNTGVICMKPWGNINHKHESCNDFSSFVSPSQISSWYPIADRQFTGLLDRNGKEIYEGDIVKTNVYICINKDELKKAGGDLFVIPKFEEQDRYCQIDWYNGVRVSGWRLLGKDKRYQTQLKWSTIGNMKIEIIGNIYENKNLI